MNSNFQSYIGEIKMSSKDSLNFLERMLDIPQADPLACALFANSKFDPTVFIDVETPASLSSLLCCTMFASDTPATSKARAEAGGEREAQILMGELPENL